MKRSTIVLVSLAVCGQFAAGQMVSDERTRAFEIERAIERIAREVDLWPGYEPLTVPLAVFTGESTYLFRHPAPPEGFTAIPGDAGHVFDGRYPAVTANSSAEVGGMSTATLLAAGARADLSSTEQAAVALHEAFHVYQRAHHPGWSANEGDLLLYPVADSRLLALRRLESVALGHALDAESPATSACWARRALEYRTRRFALMESAFADYERRSELNEGLAAYVQLRAAGHSTVEIPAAGFPAAAVRERSYVVGPALAILLDRLRPGWQAELESSDDAVLDHMLESAAAPDAAASDEPCEIEPAATADLERTATADAAAVLAQRRDRRTAFDARGGWRVVVEAPPEEPLWPQGFDPLNFARVDGGVLHTRFLHLGNDQGELQAIDEKAADIEALTEAVGPHPLFNGVRRVTVAGLSEPEVTSAEDGVTIAAPGLTARFARARVRTDGMEVRVVVGEPAEPDAPKNGAP